MEDVDEVNAGFTFLATTVIIGKFARDKYPDLLGDSILENNPASTTIVVPE